MPALVAFVVLCAGTGIAVQMPLMALVVERLGLLWGLLVVNSTGLVVVALILASRTMPMLSTLKSLPWYVYIAGPLGMGVMGALAYAIPRIGITATLVLSITAQLLVGVLLDRVGFLGMEVRGLDLSRIAGVAVVAIGTWLVVR
ncbi:DMT family transporter [Candidatus Bipolaricaulota bacterium]